MACIEAMAYLKEDWLLRVYVKLTTTARNVIWGPSTRGQARWVILSYAIASYGACMQIVCGTLSKAV